MKNLAFYTKRFVSHAKYETYTQCVMFGKLAYIKYNNNVTIYWNIKAYKFVVDGICWEYQPITQKYSYKPYDKNNYDHVKILCMFGVYSVANIAYVGNYIVGFKVNETHISLQNIMDRIADKYLVHGNKQMLLDRLSILPKNNNDLI